MLRPASTLTFDQRRELRALVSQARLEKIERERKRRREAALRTLRDVAGDYRMTPHRQGP